MPEPRPRTTTATKGFSPEPVEVTQSTGGWGPGGWAVCGSTGQPWNVVTIVKIRLLPGCLYDDENVLELDSGDGSRTLYIYQTH